MNFVKYSDVVTDSGIQHACKLAVKARYYYDRDEKASHKAEFDYMNDKITEEEYKTIQNRKKLSYDDYYIALRFLEAIFNARENNYTLDVHCVNEEDEIYTIEDEDSNSIFFLGKYDAWV